MMFINQKGAKPMTTYKVQFSYTVYGTATIETETPEQAEKLIYTELADNGIDELKYTENDREYLTNIAEEVTK